LLAALNVCVACLFVACAPDGSRIKDSAPTSGMFENHHLVFSLPAVNKKPATSYCIEIPTGGTLDVSSNKYKCNFFEFAANGGSFVGTTPGSSDGKGNPAACSFDGNGGVRTFSCTYSYTEGTDTKSHACSAYKETLQDTSGKPASLIQIKNESKPFQAEAINMTSLGNSAAGSPYPAAEQIAFAEGTCAEANKKILSGQSPAASSSTGKTVTFELKTSTAIKTSSDQSNSTSMVEGTTKCTITKPAGTVTLTAQSISSSPSGAEKHYVLSKLISVTDASKTELCKDFISKNPTGSVYLFGDHWDQKTK
jgi:hypothetical protein